jgi:hypothetical protein
MSETRDPQPIRASGDQVVEHAFVTAWADGRAMALEQAIADTLETDG